MNVGIRARTRPLDEWGNVPIASRVFADRQGAEILATVHQAPDGHRLFSFDAQTGLGRVNAGGYETAAGAKKELTFHLSEAGYAPTERQWTRHRAPVPTQEQERAERAKSVPRDSNTVNVKRYVRQLLDGRSIVTEDALQLCRRCRATYKSAGPHYLKARVKPGPLLPDGACSQCRRKTGEKWDRR